MPDKNFAERTVVSHPGAVAVVTLDDASRVLMIRQYRHPVGYQLWEIPAGLRDAAGEPPLETARRELFEETGYRAREWHVLHRLLHLARLHHRAAPDLPGPRR